MLSRKISSFLFARRFTEIYGTESEIMRFLETDGGRLLLSSSLLVDVLAGLFGASVNAGVWL